jgi:hypothetical protein
MKKLIFIVGACLAASMPATAQKITSVYTSTNTKACRTIESDPNEAGSYLGRCKGVGGYALDLSEGDLRQSLDLITPSKKKFELNLTSFFSSFSALGEKVEWRLRKGVPIALIVRYYVADPEGRKKDTPYLIVASVSRKSSCVIDIIDPAPHQNEKARKSADSAATTGCYVMKDSAGH